MTNEDKLEQLKRGASEIFAWMQEPPSDVPELLAERLAMINVYLATSGEMLADAKQLLNLKVVEVYEKQDARLQKAGAQMAKMIVAGYCAKEQYLVDWLERINRGLVHSADNLRTLVSLAKENMRINHYAGNVRPDVMEDDDNDDFSNTNPYTSW